MNADDSRERGWLLLAIGLALAGGIAMACINYIYMLPPGRGAKSVLPFWITVQMMALNSLIVAGGAIIGRAAWARLPLLIYAGLWLFSSLVLAGQHLSSVHRRAGFSMKSVRPVEFWTVIEHFMSGVGFAVLILLMVTPAAWRTALCRRIGRPELAPTRLLPTHATRIWMFLAPLAAIAAIYYWRYRTGMGTASGAGGDEVLRQLVLPAFDLSVVALVVSSILFLLPWISAIRRRKSVAGLLRVTAIARFVALAIAIFASLLHLNTATIPRGAELAAGVISILIIVRGADVAALCLMLAYFARELGRNPAPQWQPLPLVDESERLPHDASQPTLPSLGNALVPAIHLFRMPLVVAIALTVIAAADRITVFDGWTYRQSVLDMLHLGAALCVLSLLVATVAAVLIVLSRPRAGGLLLVYAGLWVVGVTLMELDNHQGWTTVLSVISHLNHLLNLSLLPIYILIAAGLEVLSIAGRSAHHDPSGAARRSTWAILLTAIGWLTGATASWVGLFMYNQIDMASLAASQSVWRLASLCCLAFATASAGAAIILLSLRRRSAGIVLATIGIAMVLVVLARLPGVQEQMFSRTSLNQDWPPRSFRAAIGSLAAMVAIALLMLASGLTQHGIRSASYAPGRAFEPLPPR